MTFFGVEALSAENRGRRVPAKRGGSSSLDLTYSDEDDVGSASVTGNSDWALAWKFDGLAYEEHAAVLASLADDF